MIYTPVLYIDIADDEQEYVELTRKLLLLNGLPAPREFNSPEQYSEALRVDPKMKTDLIITDYRFSHTSNGDLTGIDIVIAAKARNKFVKAIMISDYPDPDVHDLFFHSGGTYWIRKSKRNFQPVFVKYTMTCLQDIRVDARNRELLAQLDGSVIRTAREPLSTPQTTARENNDTDDLILTGVTLDHGS